MDSLIYYKIFRSYPVLKHFTTTRNTIDEAHPRFTGSNLQKITRSKQKLATVVNQPVSEMVFPRQTHSDNVARIDTVCLEEIGNTDALVTNKPNICICIQTADCVPILFFDPQKKVIALAHAGWRGTVKRIATKVVFEMNEFYQSNPKNILVAIGPAISKTVYEVGSEVVEMVRRVIPNPETSLHKNSLGRYHFDLWDANRKLLISAGIKNENIELIQECSFINKEKYFSARREGAQTGRMVSGMVLTL